MRGRTVLFLILAVLFLIVGILMFNFNKDKTGGARDEGSAKVIFEKDIQLKAQVLKSREEKIRGLSGAAFLPQDQGALFVYEEPGFYSFWMKEMNFAIDIIWIGEDFKVVDVTHQAKPESFPERFSPRNPARYVLEVNAGFAKANDIAIGSWVVIKGY